MKTSNILAEKRLITWVHLEVEVQNIPVCANAVGGKILIPREIAGGGGGSIISRQCNQYEIV